MNNVIPQIYVGTGTCGISAGAQKVYDKLSSLIDKEKCGLNETGCIGMCYREPLVEVRQGSERTIYGGVTPKLAKKIYEQHILSGEPLKEYIVHGNKEPNAEEQAFLKQKRIVLRNCGVIDPEIVIGLS
jgi:NADH-quinone oxidoreductase subunit F